MGITLNNPIRVSVNGVDKNLVRTQIDMKGYADVEIQYLEILPSGKYRQPTFKRLMK